MSVTVTVSADGKLSSVTASQLGELQKGIESATGITVLRQLLKLGGEELAADAK